MCLLHSGRCPFAAASAGTAALLGLLDGKAGGTQGFGGSVADGVAYTDDAHISRCPQDGQSGVAIKDYRSVEKEKVYEKETLRNQSVPH